MLKESHGDREKNRIAIRKLSHNPSEWTTSLFCQGCPDFNRCGGIAAESGAGYCYDNCCGGESGCQTVCRNNPDYQRQVKEIGGFDLENTPHTKVVSHSPMHGIVPLIIHGKKRSLPLTAPIVAVKLRDVVNLKTGRLKHNNRSELADALKIQSDAKLIVTGIEQDHHVEPWWSIGRAKRIPLLSELVQLGIDLMTPPNFSLFCDVPRPNDFSAMKRIALVHAEFLTAGIPCALHAHIQNEKDSDRWTAYVADRPEVTSIAYEFGTGAGRDVVRRMHLDHLVRLAEVANRPLDLVVRGDQRILPVLTKAYRNVIYIDTNAFMKTMYRQTAVRVGNKGLKWVKTTTPPEASLDELMQHNVDEVTLTSQQLLKRVA